MVITYMSISIIMKERKFDMEIYDIINELGETPEINEGELLRYKDSTYEIVSKVGYLIGVPTKFFGHDNSNLQKDIYDELESDKNARIIRNLCLIRTAIEKHYTHINNKIRYEYKTIFTIPEYVPVEAINKLTLEGINLFKSSRRKLFQNVVELNKHISDRINNCKSLFPLWINWDYIKELFIMPNGLTEHGVKNAGEIYCAHKKCYPYQTYINWSPRECGNILYNDKKFVSILYSINNDEFAEYSKVSDAGVFVKESIYDYIERNKKVVVVVDCENSDPYKLCATFRNLDYKYTQKISSIILFDDIHTATTWRILEQFTQIPVEHVMIERVKENKSLVDIKLTARACQEHYKNNVDAFVIVSSDSDYWGLISSLPDAEFLVMIERANCGQELKHALNNAGIFYCFIDDFYSGNTEDIKQRALFQEMHKYINNIVKLNVNEMFEDALTQTRIEMTDAEKKQFFNKYVKNLELSISAEGNVVIKFKNK